MIPDTEEEIDERERRGLESAGRGGGRRVWRRSAAWWSSFE